MKKISIFLSFLMINSISLIPSEQPKSNGLNPKAAPYYPAWAPKPAQTTATTQTQTYKPFNASTITKKPTAESLRNKKEEA